MPEYTTTLSIKECEARLNAAISRFPKKQRERNKIICFRGKAKNGKLHVIFSRPLNFPYHRRQGNIAVVGKMREESGITRLQVKFVSPVLISSFYLPYFTAAFVILGLYSILENIPVLSLYIEVGFFLLVYVLLILFSRNNSQSRMDKILKFVESTLEMTEVGE